MENKPTQNIQDSFLNTARKDKTVITLYLLSGVKLTGRIRSFDKYSVVLETNNQEQLIFKHAISTVVMNKAHGFDRPAPTHTPGAMAPGPTATSPNSAPAASQAAGAPSPAKTEG
jgi:host factor-I protein